MKCHNCGEYCPEDAMFCVRCGSPLLETKNRISDQADTKNIKLKIFVVIIFILFFVFLFIVLTLEVKKTTKNKPPRSDEYDAILASGDNYHLVYKRVDTLEESYDMIGVVNSKGGWIQPLSRENIFINEYGEIECPETHHFTNSSDHTAEEKIEDLQRNIFYIGEGMFLLTYDTYGYYPVPEGLVYNADQNIGFNIGKYTSDTDYVYDISAVNVYFAYAPSTVFQDGYWVMHGYSDQGWCIKIIDKSGNVTQTALTGKDLGQYAEGLFYLDKCFYDINLNKCIDLSKYSISNRPFFQNGKAELEINNGENVFYKVHINTNGEFLEEPQKIEK